MKLSTAWGALQRSAFKAGITPSPIAREFGIALADVRQALARDEMDR
jgi:hypothetical protein